jgi:hypothetical protein
VCPDQFWGPPSLLSSGYRGSIPRGVKCGQGVTLTTNLHLVPRSRISWSYISSRPWSLHGAAGQLYLYAKPCSKWAQKVMRRRKFSKNSPGMLQLICPRLLVYFWRSRKELPFKLQLGSWCNVNLTHSGWSQNINSHTQRGDYGAVHAAQTSAPELLGVLALCCQWTLPSSLSAGS